MKQIIIIVLILISIKIQAQTPQWQWINVGGGNGNPHQANMLNLRTKQIGTDAMGNIYGIATTNGDVSVDTLSPLNGILYDDFVIFSYTCDGQFRWMQLFGSVFDDIPAGIVVSPNGDVYVGGNIAVSYWGDAHFADSIIPATNNMNKGYFLAKLDSSGHLTQLNLPGPPTSVVGSFPMRMEADKNGNPVVLTWFSDSATWNGHHINGRGHYLVKFDKNCNLTDIVELDFKLNNGISNYRFMEFTIDTDNSVYLYSSVSDTVFIGNDTLGIDPNIKYHEIRFISKFDFITGQNIWFTKIEGSGYKDSVQYLTGKPKMNNSIIYMGANTKSYQNSKFLGIPINNPIASSNSTRTKVFASFDKNSGNIINAINIKSVSNIDDAPIDVQDNHLIAAPTGGGMVILNITDTLMLGNSPFVVSMDTGLTYYNWGTAARLLLSNTHLTPTYLHVDHNNNILLGGGLTGPITNTAGDTTNLVASAENFCIAKIALTNDSCGCAASVPSIAVVSSSGNTLIVNGSATNQADSLYIFWGDGDSTLYNTPNTDISHTYSNTGPWNVCLIAYGFCGVEDTCLSNLYSGIYPSENTIELMMNVYPNPFNDRLNIELTKNINNGEIYIYDMLGKQVYYNQFSGKQININTSELMKGFYFIKLTINEGSVIVKKLVKN